MSAKLQAPRGTYDVLPEAADARAALEATLADRLGARYVAMVDGDGGAVLKDMHGGEQQDVGAAEVVARILRERGRR